MKLLNIEREIANNFYPNFLWLGHMLVELKQLKESLLLLNSMAF